MAHGPTPPPAEGRHTTTIKITSPAKGYTGSTYIGPTILDFEDGVATTDVDLSGGIRGYLKVAGYKVDDGGGEQSNKPADVPFDPSEHTVDDVLAHLAGADATEVGRVKAAEAAGKDRKGIAEYEQQDGEGK